VIQNNESVLIDTSTWIAAFRGNPVNITEITRTLLNDDRALTCGPVLFEIYRGLRAWERKKIIPLMKALIRLPIDEKDWEIAGNLDASLRTEGITIPPMDLLIAQICLRNNVPIFALDQHFESIKGLRFFTVENLEKES
jgi:predicted nucleic acid-binding protein